MSSTETLTYPIGTLEDHDVVVREAIRLWPHEVAYRTTLTKDSEARDWAAARYGGRGNDTNADKTSVILKPDASWVESGEHFRFKHQHDAFEFKMRWV